jgi:hypothetical protein
MNLSLQPRLRLALRCNTCGQLVEQETRDEQLVDVLMFGTMSPYAVCVGCLQDMTYPGWADPEYQRRFRVTLFKKYGTVVRVG